MRWNCPHCGVNLAVSDDKMGTGWSFSRCYKCGGFALIRRAEVNLVKVDRAPAGEHIILPEATEEPLSMLSEEASQNLSRLRRENAERAAARTATKAAAPAPAPTPISTPSAAPELPPRPAQAAASAPEIKASLTHTPPPVPPAAAKRRSFRVMPVGIAVTALMTVSSGVYFYLQGQALWDKAQPRQNLKQTAARGGEIVAAPTLTSTLLKTEMTDQVHHGAMAPVRDSARQQPSDADTSAAEAGLQPSAQEALRRMSTLVVQPRGRSADLHSGPGSLYPSLGMANPNAQYMVTDWSDRWFKVMLKDEALKAAANPSMVPRTAWVRTDLVQVVQSTGQEALPPHP